MVRKYAAWNPSDKGSAITLSNNNLTAAGTTTWNTVRSTLSKTTGKWYWELTVDVFNTNSISGTATSSHNLSSYVSSDAYGWGYWGSNGNGYTNDGVIWSGATYGAGTVLGFALDADADTLKVYKNNVLQGTFSSIAGAVFAACSPYSGQVTANFGATAFTYTPPAGYNAGLYEDSTLVVSDSFAGTTIDAGKWIETDPSSIISQNERIIFDLSGGHTDKARFANRLQSVSSIPSNTAVAQANLDWTDPGDNEAMFGLYLYKDSSNYAYIGSRSSGGTFRLVIQSGGSQVYTLNSAIAKAKDVKIWTDGTSIKFYYWDGSAWAQIGTTQTYALGYGLYAMLSGEDNASYLNGDIIYADGFYMYDVDYATHYPDASVIAIRFDSSTGRSNATGTSMTYAHTCGTGSNRYLVVAVNHQSDTLTGATYNSVTMTLLRKVQEGAVGTSWLSFYGLANPASGANNVVISSSSSIAIKSTCASYTGVAAAQPDAYNSVAETASGSRTVSITTVADNCWLIATHVSNTVQPASIVSGVNRASTINDGDLIDSNGAKTPAGAATIGYSWGGSDAHTILGISIKPYVAPVSTGNFFQFI